MNSPYEKPTSRPRRNQFATGNSLCYFPRKCNSSEIDKLPSISGSNDRPPKHYRTSASVNCDRRTDHAIHSVGTIAIPRRLVHEATYTAAKRVLLKEYMERQDNLKSISKTNRKDQPYDGIQNIDPLIFSSNEGSLNNNEEKKEEIKRRFLKSNVVMTRKAQPGQAKRFEWTKSMAPTFYIGYWDGASVVKDHLENLGWLQSDEHNTRCQLKWVNAKPRFSREGDQLISYVPNCKLFTTKLGLLSSLRGFERVSINTKGRPPELRLGDIIPESFNLDDRNDLNSFLQKYKDGEHWICKADQLDAGTGICIIRSQQEVNDIIKKMKENRTSANLSKRCESLLIQRYISNPLLLDGRKFDLRAYMLIASTSPFLVLYHEGYVRLSCQKYDSDDTNLTTHLTNQAVQRKDPRYAKLKNDTAWSMGKLSSYINDFVAEEKFLGANWVQNVLSKQMQKIMLHCFKSTKHRLGAKPGYFAMYGVDFMVDDEMKVWLLEFNTCPSLCNDCDAIKDVVPGVIKETLSLSIECFQKRRRNQPLSPTSSLSSLKNFTVLYCGE